MLEVRGLSARYDDTAVLSDVDLTVGRSEIVAVLGASGSGKTTMLRVVAGLHHPDGGAVRWEGRDLAGTPPHRRGFGMVFQDHALFPHLDVTDNVAFGLAGRSDAADRAATELERVGLAGYGDRRISELSGGQAQRVALARALAPRPRLLLLDEPLGSLDRALRRELAADLRRALRDAGTPAIHVTHDPEEAYAVADRIALLDDGAIVRIGTPELVWSAPGTEAAARLLGLTTIVDVTVGRDGVSLGYGKGRPARAIVREEAVRISADGTVAGVVETAAFRGPGHVLRVGVAGGEIAVHHHARVEPGQTVKLDVPQEAFTLLDA